VSTGVGIINNDSSLATFDVNMKILGNQSWVAQNGPLGFNNQVDIGGRTLTIGGTKSVLIGGNLIGGSGALVHAGSGLLTLSGINSFSGGLTINNGSKVALASDSAAGVSAITANGGTITPVGGSRTIANDIGGTAATLEVPTGALLTLNGRITSAQVNKTGSGNLALSGNYSSFAKMTISGGRVGLTGTGGDLIPDTATLALQSGELDAQDKSETVGTLQIATEGGTLALQPDSIHGIVTVGKLELGDGVFVIKGWLGSAMAPGTDDKVMITDTTLDPEVLKKQIYFDGFGFGGELIGNELVPIPEPGTVVLMALGCGLIVGARRFGRKQS